MLRCVELLKPVVGWIRSIKNKISKCVIVRCRRIAAERVQTQYLYKHEEPPISNPTFLVGAVIRLLQPLRGPRQPPR